MKGSRAIRKAEYKEMLKAAKRDRDKLLLMVGKTFGLRISEALALTLMALTRSEIEIRSKKGSDDVRFPVTPEIRKQAKKVIREYESKGFSVNADTPAFIGQKSRRGGTVRAISGRMAAMIVKALKEAVDIYGKLTYHGLRKAYATYYYQALGKDLFQTMKYTRHRSPASLVYYISVSQELKLADSMSW